MATTARRIRKGRISRRCRAMRLLPPRHRARDSRVYSGSAMARAAAEARADERRVAIGAFLTLFGILAAHTVLETARDALFLARLPADQLPWVYLAMAAVAVVLTQVPALRAGRGMRGSLSWSLAAMAAG